MPTVMPLLVPNIFKVIIFVDLNVGPKFLDQRFSWTQLFLPSSVAVGSSVQVELRTEISLIITGTPAPPHPGKYI